MPATSTILHLFTRLIPFELYTNYFNFHNPFDIPFYPSILNFWPILKILSSSEDKFFLSFKIDILWSTPTFFFQLRIHIFILQIQHLSGNFQLIYSTEDTLASTTLSPSFTSRYRTPICTHFFPRFHTSACTQSYQHYVQSILSIFLACARRCWHGAAFSHVSLQCISCCRGCSRSAHFGWSSLALTGVSSSILSRCIFSHTCWCSSSSRCCRAVTRLSSTAREGDSATSHWCWQELIGHAAVYRWRTSTYKRAVPIYRISRFASSGRCWGRALSWWLGSKAVSVRLYVSCPILTW